MTLSVPGVYVEYLFEAVRHCADADADLLNKSRATKRTQRLRLRHTGHKAQYAGVARLQRSKEQRVSQDSARSHI
jgi:hypothetical protein